MPRLTSEQRNQALGMLLAHTRVTDVAETSGPSIHHQEQFENWNELSSTVGKTFLKSSSEI